MDNVTDKIIDSVIGFRRRYHLREQIGDGVLSRATAI